MFSQGKFQGSAFKSIGAATEKALVPTLVVTRAWNMQLI